jgi:hypothetical protein
MNHVQKFGKWIIFGSAIVLLLAKIMIHFHFEQQTVIFSAFSSFTVLVALFVAIGLVLIFSAYTQRLLVLFIMFIIFFASAEYIVLLTGGI